MDCNSSRSCWWRRYAGKRILLPWFPEHTKRKIAPKHLWNHPREDLVKVKLTKLWGFKSRLGLLPRVAPSIKYEGIKLNWKLGAGCHDVKWTPWRETFKEFGWRAEDKSSVNTYRQISSLLFPGNERQWSPSCEMCHLHSGKNKDFSIHCLCFVAWRSMLFLPRFDPTEDFPVHNFSWKSRSADITAHCVLVLSENNGTPPLPFLHM